ncbi:MULTISPECIES: MarR family winged helix-turn-helix transcriptional regulator [Rhodomicrobium]|uniref:MarR family winged helix-turn-helix transcriptional regulator n=1 Tax=Rhodomicrobium TaxID=1068 RepID=UPI001FDA6D44|nr:MULTISPECIES: MarR family winged helix-turn-helix transcriptional regulator [Rhodomicrobium]
MCLHIQRASRAIGRHFDLALRPVGLTNWQFSMLATLMASPDSTVNGLAELLGMDRTTTTRNVKPLERRGFLEIRPDQKDARIRRILLTDAGRAILARAEPYWRRANDAVEAKLGGQAPAELRAALGTITRSAPLQGSRRSK